MSNAASELPRSARYSSVATSMSVWLFIATLAWAPFPLGGAIAWAPGLQQILIALCWVLWGLASLTAPEWDLRSSRAIAAPLMLALLALLWAIVQIVPGVPASWSHPLWGMASDALHENLPATISLNPWRTEAEIVSLSSYVMAALLAFRMARANENARLLHSAILVIASAYAVFAVVQGLAGSQQTDVFYATPHLSNGFSGPFVSRNNFATFMGLAGITAVTRLFAKGSDAIVIGHGARRLIVSVLNYCFGSGALLFVAAILALACVVASASRAGFAATMSGLAALALASLFMAHHRTSRRWAGGAAFAVLVPLLLLVVLSGGTLADRLGQLLDTGTADLVRLDLWDSARRMIADAPWLGLGLGTFQDAYPLYAVKVYPYVMDRAHCDYLEFAAGIGLPAAIAWWAAMAWIFVLLVRGTRLRRRNRVYCLVAIAVTVQIAIHSCVDFSLQLPAVALIYACILGIGLAQAFPTRAHD